MSCSATARRRGRDRGRPRCGHVLLRGHRGQAGTASHPDPDSNAGSQPQLLGIARAARHHDVAPVRLGPLRVRHRPPGGLALEGSADHDWALPADVRLPERGHGTLHVFAGSGRPGHQCQRVVGTCRTRNHGRVWLAGRTATRADTARTVPSESLAVTMGRTPRHAVTPSVAAPHAIVLADERIYAVACWRGPTMTRTVARYGGRPSASSRLRLDDAPSARRCLAVTGALALVAGTGHALRLPVPGAGGVSASLPPLDRVSSAIRACSTGDGVVLPGPRRDPRRGRPRAPPRSSDEFQVLEAAEHPARGEVELDRGDGDAMVDHGMEVGAP